MPLVSRTGLPLGEPSKLASRRLPGNGSSPRAGARRTVSAASKPTILSSRPPVPEATLLTKYSRQVRSSDALPVRVAEPVGLEWIVVGAPTAVQVAADRRHRHRVILAVAGRRRGSSG
jgi:hypothetical protein